MTTALPDGFIWICRPNDAPTVEDLAAAWLTHASAIYADYPENHEKLSADEFEAFLRTRSRPKDDTDTWGAVYDLAHEHPDHTLEFIRCVLATKPTPLVTAYLAAGTLEDVLSDHGEAIIGRVETWAEEDADFRACLAGVWQGGMSDEIWFRVCRAVGHPEISMNDPEDDSSPLTPPPPTP